MSKYSQYKIQNTQELPVSKYAKYKITSEKPQEESPSFLGRVGQFAKGALSGFGRAALEEAGSQAKTGVMEVGPGVYAPISTSSAMANIPQKGIESLESMRPKSEDSLGNILHHAGEFGGGIASFPMLPGRAAAATGAKSLLSRFGKDIGTGAAVGAGSGVLQEGGVNPLVADIGTTLALPLGLAGIKGATTGTKNILSKFSPKARQENINTEVSNILKKRIGEKHVPLVAAKLGMETPFGTKLTTAELADNAGLAGLHRALAPNIPDIAEKNIVNNALINKKLRSIGYKNNVPETVGESVRDRLTDNLARAVKIRERTTKPLYEKIHRLDTGVELPNTQAFLAKESQFAKGDIKKNLDYVKNLITSNKLPKTKSKDFEKKYGHLGQSTQALLQKEISGAPLPAELSNVIKDISGRIGTAKKAGNHEVARTLMQAKENIIKDMSAIPEEQIARSTYAKLSKPVSAIEKEPLLKKFVKKDEFGKDFILSPEKIPDLILNGTVNNTKALMKQLSNSNYAIKSIRGSIVGKLINSSELSNAEKSLSYDKVNKFLNKNKAKLNLIFEPEQIKILEDTKEILRRRNMVQTLGRATGSNTQSETTLLNDLLGTGTNKFLREAAAYYIPGGGLAYDVVKKTFKESKTQAIKALLEKALLDPKTAKLLLTPTENIKDQSTLKGLLEKIYTPSMITPIANTSTVNRKE